MVKVVAATSRRATRRAASWRLAQELQHPNLIQVYGSGSAIMAGLRVVYAVMDYGDVTLERILREIRRRTRVVGAFPDGQSALNLAAARLRHIAGTAWSTKRYLNIELLKDQQMRGAITA